MKAASLKLIKAVDSFMKEFFPEYGDYNLTVAEQSKMKGIEKGDITLSVDIKPENMPDILDSENYSTVMKKKLADILGKEIRWFSIVWKYHTDAESVVVFDICFKVA